MTQVRTGWLLGDGARHDVRTHYAMKTAVTLDGQARDGLLYGVESIAADQVFIGRIDIDADALDAVAALEGFFAEHRDVRGRCAAPSSRGRPSRGSTPRDEHAATKVSGDEGIARLAPLDLCLLEASGAHTTSADALPEALGATGWRVCAMSTTSGRARIRTNGAEATADRPLRADGGERHHACPRER